MQLWNQRRLAGHEGMPEQVQGRCCSIDDVYDARRVAEDLGIPYYVVNQEDRFEHSAIKDANGFRVMPGFEFDPLALIGGKVFIGYRHFDVVDSSVPDYSGLVADVSANYRIHATKFDAVCARRHACTKPRSPITPDEPRPEGAAEGDDALGSHRQPWPPVARLPRHVAPGVVGGDRLDRSYYVGGGVGYEMSDDLRVGVEANYYQRTSNTVTFNGYNGLGCRFSRLLCSWHAPRSPVWPQHTVRSGRHQQSPTMWSGRRMS
jgi:hypothetical protein